MRQKYAILEFNHNHCIWTTFRRVLIRYSDEPEVCYNGDLVFSDAVVLATDLDDEPKFKDIYITAAKQNSNVKRVLYCKEFFYAADDMRAKNRFYQEN